MTKKAAEKKTDDKIKKIVEEGKAKKEPEAKKPSPDDVIAELNDRLLRAAAEVENIRRRASLDVEKARLFSIESFAKDLFGVYDNLVRTLDNVPIEEAAKDEKLGNLRAGVELTKNELDKVFERNGIKCVNPVGEKFDHHLHQAMSQIEVADKESGTVVDVMQTGYAIKDRMLRPALVVVAK